MKYRVLRVPVILEPYLDYIWTIESEASDGPGLRMRSYADNVSGIIFQHVDGHSAWATPHHVRTLRKTELPTSFVYGQSIVPTLSIGAGRFSALGLVFKPQALSILMGIDACEVTDSIVPLDEFSSGGLNDQLLNSRDNDARIDILIAFLSRQQNDARFRDPLVGESLRLIHANIGSMRVGDLHRRLDVSERHLRRKFSAMIGTSPVLYLRIARFQTALRLMRDRRYHRLSDIAYALNYSDQSHFIKDIHEFSGFAPTTISQSLHSFVQNLQMDK